MEFNKRHLSPTAIVAELQQAIADLPDGDSWTNYFEGGAGRTIIELIGSSQAIKNHYNLMRVRESTLQLAKLDSSVTELAINKGVYRPPAKSIICEVFWTPTASGYIHKGQKLGTMKNYDIFAIENTEYTFAEVSSVKCAVGNMTTYELEVLDPQDFYSFSVEAPDKYVSEEFQILSVNGELVQLVDEQVNLYDPILPNSCLRLVYNDFSKLIFGDGVIGKKIEMNDKIKYTFFSFGDDLMGNILATNFSFDSLPDVAEIEKIDVLRRATGYLDKEILRKIAIRSSVDGRWVQTQDYENGILRSFGEYIDDIIVEDNYPQEDITILPKVGMITEEVKREIEELINNKRGNATLINVTYLDPEDENRLTVYFVFKYYGNDTDEELDAIIEEYTQSKINRISLGGYTLTGADIAVDLTELSPTGKFYANLEEEYQIEPLQSIKKFNITYFRE